MNNKPDQRVWIIKSEFEEATGLSRERIRQLINGYTNSRKYKGKNKKEVVYRYEIAPRWFEKTDYIYYKTDIYIKRKLIGEYKK